MTMALNFSLSLSCSLSLWERVRVRAPGLSTVASHLPPGALTPALSRREREQEGEMEQVGAGQ